MVFIFNMEEKLDNIEECRNCKYKVKKGIRRCPACGILNPTVKIIDVFKTIFIVIIVMTIFTYITNN